jgi:hypothetical protein
MLSVQQLMLNQGRRRVSVPSSPTEINTGWRVSAMPQLIAGPPPYGFP